MGYLVEDIEYFEIYQVMAVSHTLLDEIPLTAPPLWKTGTRDICDAKSRVVEVFVEDIEPYPRHRIVVLRSFVPFSELTDSEKTARITEKLKRESFPQNLGNYGSTRYKSMGRIWVQV